MSNIDKRAQKELYAKVEQQAHKLRGNPISYQVVTGMCPVNVIEMHAQKVQALLDELEEYERLRLKFQEANYELCQKLEAAEKRIAELSHHLQCAHDFIEHTEAFGYEASNGILCCGDAQWNIDASKSALASTGSINGED